jgi:hypothetical protein
VPWGFPTRPRLALLVRPKRPKKTTPNLFSGSALFCAEGKLPGLAWIDFRGRRLVFPILLDCFSHEKSRSLCGLRLHPTMIEIRTNYLVEPSRFFAAKSQLTFVQKPSMNFGRRLR